VIDRLESVTRFIDQLLQQSRNRMRTTPSFRIALAGQPNAGKSTLFNRLVGEHAALVSTVEGTTRDYLAARLDWQGPESELIDTAGWEPDSTGIICEAQAVSREQWELADLIIWCRNIDMPAYQRDADERLHVALEELGCPILLIHTKSDRRTTDQRHLGTAAINDTEPRPAPLQVSAHTGQGLCKLQLRLRQLLQDEALTHRSLIGGTAARCRDSLQTSRTALTEACTAARDRSGDELVAFSIREALDHLGRIVGAVYTEDLLDHIFSRFCIGK
ncbi:MAG: GTPase, partial [Planctomycetaceae bacterium]